MGRPRSRPNLAALCMAGLLALAATVAVAQERPVAPYAAAPAAAGSSLTSIEVDEQAGAIRIVIDGRERAIFDDAGLHVIGHIEYLGTLTDISDLRLKTEIRRLPAQSAKIADLNPVAFSMTSDSPSRTEYGLIAQEVEPVYPALVETLADGTKAVNYIGLIAPLISAVQELQADNAALLARIEALEGGRLEAPTETGAR